MQAFNEQKPTCERDTQYHSASQKLIQDKHQLAEEEKQKKLEAYKQIAQKVHQTDDGKTSVRTTTTTTKAPGDPSLSALHPLLGVVLGFRLDVGVEGVPQTASLIGGRGGGRVGGISVKWFHLRHIYTTSFRRMVDEENRPNFTRSDPSIVNVVAAVRYDRN